MASLALFRLETRSHSLPTKDQVGEKSMGLLSHADPGVRGRAALVVARYQPDKSASQAGLEPLLADEHAFVRSVAARAVGGAGLTQLAGKLAAMLDDQAPNTYDLTGWTTMRVSFRSADAAFETFRIGMNSGADSLVSVTDYGYVNDGEWHHLVVPIADLVDVGLDLTAVSAAFIMVGGPGTAGETLWVDALYLTKE